VVFYDELLRLTDPKLVVFEMDCGWVFAAGRNPVDYLSKTPERFPLLHVKDMARKPTGKFHSTVLGRGADGLQAHSARRHRPQALLHRAGRVRPSTPWKRSAGCGVHAQAGPHRRGGQQNSAGEHL
jgi:hypothetical protein